MNIRLLYLKNYMLVLKKIKTTQNHNKINLKIKLFDN